MGIVLNQSFKNTIITYIGFAIGGINTIYLYPVFLGAFGGFQRCSGDGCVALLAATGAVTAATAVVSGSIALVGNVVYWFERQGQCKPPAVVLSPAQ